MCLSLYHQHADNANTLVFNISVSFLFPVPTLLYLKLENTCIDAMLIFLDKGIVYIPRSNYRRSNNFTFKLIGLRTSRCCF